MPLGTKQCRRRLLPPEPRRLSLRSGAVSLLARWLARRSSTSTGRCCAGRRGRSSREALRDGRGRHRPRRSPARSWSTGSSTSSARPSRRWCSPARRRAFAKGWDRGHGAGGRRAGRRRAGRPACSRSPGPSSTSTGPRAARVVLATTTPVRPRQAARRRASASTTSSPPATAWTATARYDGTIDGEFVWGAGQAARPSRRGPSEHGVDLAESCAYSDSFYDVPLLSAVGHPVVVNPDPRLLALAAAAPLARRAPRRARRACPSCRCSASSRSRRCCSLRPPRAASRTPASTSTGVEHIPADGAGHPRRQPPQLLRPAGHGADASPSGAGRCASSARRRCSTPRSSVSSPRPWAASGSSGAPAPTSRWQAAAARPRGRRAGGDDAAGHDPPRARPSSTRCSRAGGARPGWPR